MFFARRAKQVIHGCLQPFARLHHTLDPRWSLHAFGAFKLPKHGMGFTQNCFQFGRGEGTVLELFPDALLHPDR